MEADGAYYLELFHGSTIAFKDMALSILPYLLTTAAKKNHVKNEIVILTATSGDTGKAALAGFSDVPGTKIIVFYPKNGVSPIQEKQMVTQKGNNTFVVGNIGTPYTQEVLKTDKDSVTVAEISSFQLETAVHFHPTVSAILNITPDHLNRHHTMENYAAVKESITKNQTMDDFLSLIHI